jgi:hypothetical protein
MVSVKTMALRNSPRRSLGPARLLLALVFFSASLSLLGQTNAGPIYFLVTPYSDRLSYIKESYVLPLTRPADIAYARLLIASNTIVTQHYPPSRGPIVVIQIAKGEDGINRNYLAPGFPAWRWHVTNLAGFTEIILAFTINGGLPSTVESNSVVWMKDIDGHVYFWPFTVAKELGPHPLFAAIGERQGGLHLTWTGVGTNVVYTIESADSPTSTNWVVETSGLLPDTTNQCVLPKPPGAARFYRIRSDPVWPPI